MHILLGIHIQRRCLSSLAVPFFVLSALLAFVRIRDSLDSLR